ncbi:MAG: hypothetical protein P8Y70_09365 [Candidatus Lokiarchaeota archaeon]
MLTKYFHVNWVYDAPEAILTCNELKCKNQSFIVFGGHDKVLYLMDSKRTLIDQIEFDGWCRCTYPIDLDNDGCDEILVGAGDGSMLVLKLNQDARKFYGLMHYKSHGKIICCTAGDLTEDGVVELIYGGDNNKLQIFSGIRSKEPKFVLYYDSWVTAVTIGLLKVKGGSELTRVLVVGTKNGDIQVLEFNDGGPNIIWQKNLSVRINDIKIGDVANDRENKIIIASDDSYVKILDPLGKRLYYKKILHARPLRILVNDIDGDNANEIIVGAADGSLKVFYNVNYGSISYDLKWKMKVKSSIKDVFVTEDKQHNLKDIIFGGYNRELYSIYDFKYAEKEKINIERRSIEKELLTDTIVPLDRFSTLKVGTNVKDKIQEFVTSRSYQKLDDLKEDLHDFGYPTKKITSTINSLLKNNNLVQKLARQKIWKYELKEELVKVEEVHRVEKAEIIDESEFNTEDKKYLGKLSQFKNKITKEEFYPKDLKLKFLRDKGVISSKRDLITNISEQGFTEKRVEAEIDTLKELNIIEYTRSKPRGWQLRSDKPIKVDKIQELKEETFQEESEIEIKIIELLKNEAPIISKAKLIEKIVTQGYEYSLVESQIDKLNALNKISYSRSKPKGWKLG